MSKEYVHRSCLEKNILFIINKADDHMSILLVSIFKSEVVSFQLSLTPKVFGENLDISQAL